MEGLAIRGVVAVVISFLVAIRAFKHRSLSKSGAFVGFLVLSIHIAASYRSESVLCSYSSFLLHCIFWGHVFVDNWSIPTCFSFHKIRGNYIGVLFHLFEVHKIGRG